MYSWFLFYVGVAYDSAFAHVCMPGGQKLTLPTFFNCSSHYLSHCLSISLKLSKLSWMASKPLGSACPLNVGATVAHTCANLLHGCKLKYSYLGSKHFTHRVAFIAPSTCILFVIPLWLLYKLFRGDWLDLTFSGELTSFHSYFSKGCWDEHGLIYARKGSTIEQPCPL